MHKCEQNITNCTDLLFCKVDVIPLTICLSASVSSLTCLIPLSVVWLISLLTLFSSLIIVFSASTTAANSAGICDSLVDVASVLLTSAAIYAFSRSLLRIQPSI